MKTFKYDFLLVYYLHNWLKIANLVYSGSLGILLPHSSVTYRCAPSLHLRTYGCLSVADSRPLCVHFH